MQEGIEGHQPGVTSRRDALKLGGVAALGGAAVALAASAAGATEAGAVTSPPAHIPTSLKVTIDGAAVQGVRSMEVLSASYAQGHSTGSQGTWVSTPIGLDSQVVSFTRYFTGDAALSNLYQSQNGKPGQARTVIVRVYGRQQSLANTFTLIDCFPVSWQGPTYDAAVMAKGGSGDRPTESITLSFQKIEFK
jgi:hypothetical protein